MRHPTLIALVIAAAVLCHAGPAAADPRAPLDEVLASAAHVRLEALQIERHLRDRRPDFAIVLQRLSVLRERVRLLEHGMRAIDIEAMSLVPADRESLRRAVAAGESLVVLLEHKARMLSDPARAVAGRSLIRAKAAAIAERAEVIEEQVSLVRG